MDRIDEYDEQDYKKMLLLAARQWWTLLPFKSQMWWGGSPEEAVEGLMTAYDRGER